MRKTFKKALSMLAMLIMLLPAVSVGLFFDVRSDFQKIKR